MSEEQHSLRVRQDPHVSHNGELQVGSPEDAGEVTIIVTQAYCPNGHKLVADGNASFDGHPGLRLRVSHGDQAAEVVLSPIHGDAKKQLVSGQVPADGARLEVSCPECGVPLPVLESCVSGDGGSLRVIYLTARRHEGSVALVCDVWGCPYSRILDDWDLLSEVVLQETAELEEL